MDSERGTGRTTRQMQEAPPGAVFVWCNEATGYARDLARRIGRSDLRVMSLGAAFYPGAERLRGLAQGMVVIDHAAELTPWQRELVAEVLR